MLVLSRKCEEVVVVGGPVGFEPLLKITVVEVNGGTVRLGFEARADVPIHRLEVWERIRARDGPQSPVEGAGAPVV
jgi:carbon storage regulator CsrA